MAGHGFELDPIAMKDPGATSTIYMGFEEPMVGDSSVNFSIWVLYRVMHQNVFGDTPMHSWIRMHHVGNLITNNSRKKVTKLP